MNGRSKSSNANFIQLDLIKFYTSFLNYFKCMKSIFLKIDFQDKMLNIPVIGSSTENDIISNLKIDSTKINKWMNGGLSNSEIYLSQKLSSKMMKRFGYEKKKFFFPPLFVFFHLISLPIKLGFAFIFNIHR